MKNQRNISELVLDSSENSIKYHKIGINSTVNLQKISSLDELEELFKQGESPLMYDTRDFMSVIDKDGNENYLCHPNSDLFLKIKVNDNPLHDILIALDNNHYVSDETHVWIMEDVNVTNGICYDNLFDMKDHYDGYVKSFNLIQTVQKYSDKITINMPALQYCWFKCIINGNNGNVYHGYLPSLPQLMFLDKHKDLINYIFDALGYSHILKNQDLWSSTEYDDNFVWTHISSWGQTFTIGKPKHRVKCHVMPLFINSNADKSISYE